MKIKDLIGISLLSISLFPVIMITVMLATGVVHLEFGKKDTKKKLEGFLKSYSPAQDEAEAKQMKAFEALEKKQKDIEDQKRDLNLQIERLENLKLETAKQKEEIIKNRKRIEELVAISSDLEEKRLASLADVYSSMRPEEAAPILLTLSNDLAVKILSKMQEARSAAKILAAMSNQDMARAARMTQMLGMAPKDGGKK